jgi:hypothetical protein
MRRIGFVLGLAWHRLRARSAGALLAGSGIAIGTAVVTGVLVGTTVAQDRSTSQAVERLAEPSRSTRAVWFGVPAGADERYRPLDAAVRKETSTLPLGSPTPIVLFRESTVGGRFAGLAAVDGLAGRVLVRGGRLPRTCRPARCEVLRLRGRGKLPNVPGLRLVEVGRASLPSRVLFGDFLAPTDNALADAEVAPALRASAGYHRPPPAPLVVAEGVAGLSSSPVLADTYRSYAWVWPLRAEVPRLWEIDALLEGADRARARLAAISPSFTLAAPVEELRAAERAATVSGRRLLLVGGEAAALLFAFALLAARTMRRDLAAATRRLRIYGARRWQRGLLGASESAAVALGGGLIGWAAGICAGGVAAASAGAPVGAVLRESAFSSRGLAVGLGVVAVASLLLGLAVSVGGPDRRRFDLVDAAAVAAVAVALALALGGALDTDRQADGEGAAIALLLLPGLLAFAGAVAAARLFGPAARLVGGAARGSLTLRLAAVSLARGPGAASVTVAFLSIAFALTLLAEGYRATLSRAESDSAAFRVPLDVVVREDLRRLVPVLDAAPLDRFEDLGPGARAVPILRLQAGAGGAEGISGVTVLGLPARELPRLRGWRGEWADESRSDLAAALAPAGDARLQAPRVGGRLALRASAGLVSLRAILVDSSGRFHRLALGETPSRGTRVLRAAVPANVRGARLVAIAVDPPRVVERGADAGTALRGTLRLEGLPAANWIGTGGVTVGRSDGGLELEFVLTPQRQGLIRSRQPTDGRMPSVLATPKLGALAGGKGGVLPLQVAGERVPVRVAGIVERFPGASGELVVGDVNALGTAVNAEAPGGARTNEVWLEVPPTQAESVSAALGRPPFAALEVVSRRALEADARRDPLGHGTLLALSAAALVALLLAAVGLALSVIADLRDERGELVDLEAQGARPSLLRRLVQARALLVAAAGIAAGVLVGALLAALVTRLVTVTARAATPEPPLVTSYEPLVILLGLLAFGVVAALLVGLASQRAFRTARGPARAPELGS